MRRLTLSTKMLIAALPLVVALGALLAFTVRDDLAAIDEAEQGAELGAIWSPLISALEAVDAESAPENLQDAAAREATDRAVDDLRDAVVILGAAEAAGDHITSSRAAVSAARRSVDTASGGPAGPTQLDPATAFAQASRELVSVGQLLPAEAGDPVLGRELLAVVKLAEAKLASDRIVLGVETWQTDPTNVAQLNRVRSDFAELATVLSEFEAIAPDEWATQYRRAGFGAAIEGFRTELDGTIRAVAAGEPAAYDTTEFEALIEGGVAFQSQVSESIVERAEADAAATRTATWRRIGIALGAAALAGIIAWLITRSIAKRIRTVAHAANRVTTDQLPALVNSLSDPRGSESLPPIEPITARGDDELAELAGAFNTMQETLADVANQQVEVLRRGVSDLFVTMARRNRSLIDRQLALLDQFEAEIDDPEILSNYYQLDHMATRMRRNSESLLVLANAEPKRRRVRATEIDDVVRAAIGEIEDYRRIEIEALEPLLVRGNVVADISHLLAELLDNATSFSPPDTLVRVGGRVADNGYMIRIVDSGVGIADDRLQEVNELLRTPPVVGLAVESTLGISVVSLLANKRGIQVSLAPGNPGIIVDVVLPAELFNEAESSVDEPAAGLTRAATDTPAAPTEMPADVPSLLASIDPATLRDTGEPAIRFDEPAPAVDTPSDDDEPVITFGQPDDDRPVAASDFRSMTANLAAFQSGMRSAAASSDEPGDADAPAAPSALRVDPDTETRPAPSPTAAVEPDVETVDATEAAPPGVLEAALSGRTPSEQLPPPASQPGGEFQIPPAPPLTTASQSTQPVTPDYAHPAPRGRPSDEQSMPSLPTRLPGDGPDGGPDRLAPVPVPTIAERIPLPTRSRDDATPVDDTAPVDDAAPLDADALRDRLRSFQAEFQSALDNDDTISHPDRPGPNELGGDRR